MSFTFSYDVSHRRQILRRVLITGDLQELVPVQGHQLQQGGQAIHATMQHHHLRRRDQNAGQEAAAQLAETLQHSFGEDEQLAGVLGQAEVVILPTGDCGNVIAADRSL